MHYVKTTVQYIDPPIYVTYLWSKMEARVLMLLFAGACGESFKIWLRVSRRDRVGSGILNYPGLGSKFGSREPGYLLTSLNWINALKTCWRNSHYVLRTLLEQKQQTSSSLSLVGRFFGCFVRATLIKLWKFCVLQIAIKCQTSHNTSQTVLTQRHQQQYSITKEPIYINSNNNNSFTALFHDSACEPAWETKGKDGDDSVGYSLWTHTIINILPNTPYLSSQVFSEPMSSFMIINSSYQPQLLLSKLFWFYS